MLRRRLQYRWHQIRWQHSIRLLRRLLRMSSHLTVKVTRRQCQYRQ